MVKTYKNNNNNLKEFYSSFNKISLSHTNINDSKTKLESLISSLDDKTKDIININIDEVVQEFEQQSIKSSKINKVDTFETYDEED